MGVSYKAATRCAHVVVVLTLVGGFVLIGREAYRARSEPTSSGETTTTTKITTEKKTTSTGMDTSERREVTTAPNPNFTERALSQGGLWFLRLFLVLLGAFFAGAIVQRIAVGNFAFKTSLIENPELPVPAPAPEVTPLPPTLTEAFQSHFSLPSDTRFAVLQQESGQDIFSSSVRNIVQLLNETRGEGADYVIIDLGTGRSWLTTRLFILAILLRRMLRIRTLVFVETKQGIEQKFLGVMAPDTTRWLLAREYPWLEEAFAKAYSELPGLQIRSESGALDSSTSGMLLEHFLSNIQTPDRGKDDDWVELPPETFEHARWLNGSLLKDVLGLSPLHTSIVDLGDVTASEVTFAVLEREGPFVAVVDEASRFKSLLDRHALLESLAVLMLSAYRSPDYLREK